MAAIALAAAGLWGVARPGPAITVLGWSSVVAFILNYLLFAARRLPPHWFHLANLYAPLSLMPQLLVDRNWPVVGLETSWAILAIWGLWRGPGAALAEPS